MYLSVEPSTSLLFNHIYILTFRFVIPNKHLIRKYVGSRLEVSAFTSVELSSLPSCSTIAVLPCPSSFFFCSISNVPTQIRSESAPFFYLAMVHSYMQHGFCWNDYCGLGVRFSQPKRLCNKRFLNTCSLIHIHCTYSNNRVLLQVWKLYFWR